MIRVKSGETSLSRYFVEIFVDNIRIWSKTKWVR